MKMNTFKRSFTSASRLSRVWDLHVGVASLTFNLFRVYEHDQGFTSLADHLTSRVIG